jgi:hypothetical protein
MKTQSISLLFAGALAACHSLPDGALVVETVRFERAAHFETGAPLIGAVLELENRSRRMVCVDYEVEGLGEVMPLDPELPPGQLLSRDLAWVRHLDGSGYIRESPTRIRRSPARSIPLAPGNSGPFLATGALVPGADYRAEIIWEARVCSDGAGAEGPVIARGPTGLRFTVPLLDE